MDDRVCCKCGALPNTLPFCYGGSDYEFHCFCCAKPPILKCIQCNANRDIELHERHGPCIGGGLHVFVHTKPWPPFPEFIPDPDARRLLTPAISPSASFQPQVEMAEEELEDSAADVISIVSDHEDNSHNHKDDISDIKPKSEIFSADSYWVTVKQISQWDHCPRCNIPRTKSSGWVSHAQKCAQDAKYRKRKFFIYVHTKGWCNYLVQDSAWDRHSNPDSGACKICRLARKNNQPLPYQPKPPPRPNEDQLAKMRRYNRRKTKEKRRSGNISNTTMPRIVNCSTLHP